MNLIEYLQDYRKEHNLTQIELAAVLGTSSHTISQWEAGNRKPTVLTENLLKFFLEYYKMKESVYALYQEYKEIQCNYKSFTKEELRNMVIKENEVIDKMLKKVDEYPNNFIDF